MAADGSATQTISYDKTSRKITITPVGQSFTFYIDGVQFTKIGAQVAGTAHGTSTGKYFFYYDSTGVLQTSALNTAWSIVDRTVTPVALVYYSNTLSDGVCFYECHTADRTLEQHYHDHFSEGTKFVTGAALTGYTLATDTDAAVTFAIGSTTIADEDIIRTLSAVADGGPYCIFYRSGVSGEWVWTTTDSYPFKVGATPLPQWNNPAGPWTLVELDGSGQGNYCNYYLCGVPSVDATTQLVLIPGQATHGSLLSAQQETISGLSLGTLPFEEIAPLYRITYHGRTALGGTNNVEISAVAAITGTSILSLTGAVATGVHNDLSGRSTSDAHPASAVTFTPYSTLASTNVQAAIQELLDESGGGPGAGVVPIGGIIMWSGTIATIPATWALCDGTANAPGPDLRDKFVVGAKQDDAGVAKSNILGSLSQTGGATGHSHSGHANLTHAGGAVGDHTGFTHGLTISNHPDLTHAAIGDHASFALTHADHASAADISVPSQAIASLANLSRPAVGHTHASGVDISIASQAIASAADISIASHTVSVPSQGIASGADISIGSWTMAQASAAGVASFAQSTNRSGLTARAAYTHTIPAVTGSRPSLAVASVAGSASAITGSRPSLAVAAVTGSRPALADAGASGADVSMPTLPVASAVASRPALSHASHAVAAQTHGGVGTHAGTDYGAHAFTAPAAHGTAGTVTHSFTQPSDHTLSAHDTVSMVPSFFALAFIQRMS